MKLPRDLDDAELVRVLGKHYGHSESGGLNHAR